MHAYSHHNSVIKAIQYNVSVTTTKEPADTMASMLKPKSHMHHHSLNIIHLICLWVVGNKSTKQSSDRHRIRSLLSLSLSLYIVITSSELPQENEIEWLSRLPRCLSNQRSVKKSLVFNTVSSLSPPFLRRRLLTLHPSTSSHITILCM